MKLRTSIAPTRRPLPPTAFCRFACLAVPLLAGALPGCATSSAGSCEAVHAELPESAAAGTTVTVEVGGLWATCNDAGQVRPREPLEEVTLTAFLTGDPNTVVVSSTSPVSDDAEAILDLPIPADASGSLVVAVDGTSLGTITVEGD